MDNKLSINVIHPHPRHPPPAPDQRHRTLSSHSVYTERRQPRAEQSPYQTISCKSTGPSDGRIGIRYINH